MLLNSSKIKDSLYITVKPLNRRKTDDLYHLLKVGLSGKRSVKERDCFAILAMTDSRHCEERSSLFNFCRIFLVVWSCFVFSGIKASQKSDEPKIRYTDTIYKDYIKSLQLHQIGWKFSPPIVQLNSGDLLQLDFDDLAGDFVQYSYTLVHCDADWSPSDIVAFDYLKGFSTDQINEYYYSFNTFQKYTHYRLVLPNANMQLLLSGNYILKVFKDNNPDSLIFTRKVYVYENGVSVLGTEKRGIGGGLFTKQEVMFTINTLRMQITDPFHALQIFVSQNGRWDNALTGFQPNNVQGNSLIYDLDYNNSFDGGNQFRSFDMTSLKYLTQNEDAFVDNKETYEIKLKPDEPRTSQQYYTFADIGGQYLIQDKDDDSTPINSQYVWIDFYMPLDSEITTGKLYIFGALSDWKCQSDFEMHYNKMRHGYVGSAYLKQGYYEYQYAYLKNGSGVADVTLIEGNHFETTNTYFFYVYYRQIGLFYDKLVGFSTLHAPSN